MLTQRELNHIEDNERELTHDEIILKSLKLE